MTIFDIDLRLRQMHASLEGLRSDDVLSVKAYRRVDPTGQFYTVGVDYNKGISDAELLNLAEKLVENIARLKDHLKVWCQNHGVPFHGEDLINTDQSVAIVHDLWNIQKHGKLNRRPRSGVLPRIVGLRRSMKMTTGPGPSAIAMSMDPTTGEMKLHKTGEGKAELVIDGQIHDEQGNRVGRFVELCELAVTSWETLLQGAGVPLP